MESPAGFSAVMFFGSGEELTGEAPLSTWVLMVAAVGLMGTVQRSLFVLVASTGSWLEV